MVLQGSLHVVLPRSGLAAIFPDPPPPWTAGGHVRRCAAASSWQYDFPGRVPSQVVVTVWREYRGEAEDARTEAEGDPRLCVTAFRPSQCRLDR